MKMILMSALHHLVSIMPPVAMFLGVIPASAHQDIPEGCAIQTLMNVWYLRVRTEVLAGMG